MTEHPEQVIEGDEDPPDVAINAVGSDEDPDHLYNDPDMGDMPDDLPPGSFEADRADTQGADDLPEG